MELNGTLHEDFLPTYTQRNLASVQLHLCSARFPLNAAFIQKLFIFLVNLSAWIDCCVLYFATVQGNINRTDLQIYYPTTIYYHAVHNHTVAAIFFLI